MAAGNRSDSKPKTSKQIKKWLADPYSDSAEYKMWGNGVALPCVVSCFRALCITHSLTCNRVILHRKIPLFACYFRALE